MEKHSTFKGSKPQDCQYVNKLLKKWGKIMKSFSSRSGSILLEFKIRKIDKKYKEIWLMEQKPISQKLKYASGEIEDRFEEKYKMVIFCLSSCTTMQRRDDTSYMHPKEAANMSRLYC